MMTIKLCSCDVMRLQFQVETEHSCLSGPVWGLGCFSCLGGLRRCVCVYEKTKRKPRMIPTSVLHRRWGDDACLMNRGSHVEGVH
eukprot:3392386-Rhodomonas_salina.3